MPEQNLTATELMVRMLALCMHCGDVRKRPVTHRYTCCQWQQETAIIRLTSVASSQQVDKNETAPCSEYPRILKLTATTT